MFGLGRKKQQQRADPVAIWLNGDEAKDILCPSGYTPLNKNEEVQKCAHKIADLVSNMTIMLMENGKNGDKRVYNELSKKVDIYPNENMTRKQFVYRIVRDMIDTGNSVVLPVIKDGLIADLQILDISCVSFEKSDTGYRIRYKGKYYLPEEVLHFVLVPKQDEPWRGEGLANQLKDTIGNLVQANATKTAFLKSKWKPSMIISIMADIEELEDEEQRKKILGSYTKTTELGEPWLIPAGELDIKEIRPLSLQDLAIQDSITLDKKVVASAFGVPGFLVGCGEYKTEEYNNFISGTIGSYAMIIQQELSKKLIYKPEWYFKLSPRSLMQYNLKEKTSYVKEMVSSGMLTRNEGRNEFDYSPVDNAGMDEYIVLENFVPVSKVGNQKKLNGGMKNDKRAIQ